MPEPPLKPSSSESSDCQRMMPSSSSSEAQSEAKFSVIVPVMKLPVVGPALPPPWQVPPTGLPLMPTFRSPPTPSRDGKPPGAYISLTTSPHSHDPHEQPHYRTSFVRGHRVSV